MQQNLVKTAFGIVFSVAAGHKIHEVPQVFQTQRRLLRCDGLPGVGSVVALLPDVFHAEQEVSVVNESSKTVVLHKAHQPVIPRQGESPVYGVHPLDGKLHGTAAVEGAGRRVDGEDALGADGNLGKALKLWVCG